MKPTVLVMILMVAAGCSSPAPSAAPSGDDVPAADFPEVVCTVAYREAETEPLASTDEVTLQPGEEQVLEFDEVTVAIVYGLSVGEGAALRIDARTPGADDYVTRNLYQLIAGEPPGDAFAGGHGFTGLVYVHPPGTTAEAQFFCAVP